MKTNRSQIKFQQTIKYCRIPDEKNVASQGTVETMALVKFTATLTVRCCAGY